MPTMQDVARHANVSLSTVSYVLSGARPVSDATKKRVHSSMQKLGYSPHAVARGLASKRTRIIALVYSPPERGIGLTEIEFVTYAAEAARNLAYHLVLWTIEPKDLDGLKTLLNQNLIDGVILMEVLLEDPRLSILEDYKIPFSIIGRTKEDREVSYVDIDVERSAREVQNFLQALGHKNLAFFNQSKDIFNSGYGPSVRAHETFKEICQKSDMEFIEYFCHPSPLEGYKVLRQYLEEYPEGTAIVIMNDRIIPGILRGLNEAGKKVPQDYSIISILSSSRVSEMFNPALSTWSVASSHMAKTAVQQLIHHLDQANMDKTNVLVPCLIEIAGSTGRSRT